MTDQKKYFPSRAVLEGALCVNLTTSAPSERVGVTIVFLKALIGAALASIEFNEGEYLAWNPDLELAWREGEIENLKEHFVSTGYFEGRSVGQICVDEKWYLERYEDVATAIRAGLVNSARDHYEKTGHREGRSPNGLYAKEMAVWRAALRTNPGEHQD